MDSVPNMPIVLLRAPCGWTLTLCDCCESNLRMDTVPNQWESHAWKKVMISNYCEIWHTNYRMDFVVSTIADILPSSSIPYWHSYSWLGRVTLLVEWRIFTNILGYCHNFIRGASRIQNHRWSSFNPFIFWRLCSNCWSPCFSCVMDGRI